MLNDVFYSLGKADARNLRVRAKSMDGTQIINEENKIPTFTDGKDYSKWPVGSPVQDDGQIWQLIQPYNSSVHPGHPGELRALWGLCHTKDSAKAKAWVDPFGTSGLYLKDECYKDGDKVWRCKVPQTNFSASASPDQWEIV